MGPISIGIGTSAGTLQTSASATADDKKLTGAASQFEALMIGQLLKSAHGSESEGWMGAGDDDDSSLTAIQMAEEYLGQAIANGGGLGIAKMVIQGVNKGVPKHQPAESR
jgi:Rod binding domain-containing protein